MVDWQAKADKETWQVTDPEDWQMKRRSLGQVSSDVHAYGINTYGLGVYGIGVSQVVVEDLAPIWQNKIETDDMMSKTPISWQEKL